MKPGHVTPPITPADVLHLACQRAVINLCPAGGLLQDQDGYLHGQGRKEVFQIRGKNTRENFLNDQKISEMSN